MSCTAQYRCTEVCVLCLLHRQLHLIPYTNSWLTPFVSSDSDIYPFQVALPSHLYWVNVLSWPRPTHLYWVNVLSWPRPTHLYWVNVLSWPRPTHLYWVNVLSWPRPTHLYWVNVLSWPRPTHLYSSSLASSSTALLQYPSFLQ